MGFAGHLRSAQRDRNLAQADRDDWQIRRQEAQVEWETARRAQPVWRRVLRLSSSEVLDAQERVAEAARQATRADGLSRALIDREQSQSAGVDGERRFEIELASLSDEWLMLRGYRDRRGEADCVLVGPGGVWTVEVKNRNAVLLVHHKARIAQCVRPGVDLVATDVAKLRDHRHHEKNG